MIVRGALANTGYAVVSQGRRRFLAHRFVYEIFVAKIPSGLVLDHLCRNRACVLPSHLRITTHRENILAGSGATARHAIKTHCNRGHEYTPENTVLVRHGRRCRICRDDYRRQFHRANYVPRRKTTDICKRGHRYDGVTNNGRKRTCSACHSITYGPGQLRIYKGSWRKPKLVETVLPRRVE